MPEAWLATISRARSSVRSLSLCSSRAWVTISWANSSSLRASRCLPHGHSIVRTLSSFRYSTAISFAYPELILNLEETEDVLQSLLDILP